MAFLRSGAPKVAYVSHHLAHAASAYRCSPFEEATLLAADSEGDLVPTSDYNSAS